MKRNEAEPNRKGGDKKKKKKRISWQYAEHATLDSDLTPAFPQRKKEGKFTRSEFSTKTFLKFRVHGTPPRRFAYM